MKNPEIIEINQLKLVGMKLKTSLSENKTFELWQSFKPRVSEISSRINRNFYSLQVYDESFSMQNLTPQTQFEKWAAVAVSDFQEIPAEMHALTIANSKYAVFIHRGTSADFAKTAGFIYGVWLPNSGYKLNNLPHFEILGEKYRLNDPNSEEEVWIPIKL